MAKELLHTIDEKLFQSGWVSSERIRTIRYGKCLTSPYVENKLWFVTIPFGLTDIAIYPSRDDKEATEPKEETTFFVAEQYATPVVINDLKRDVEKWEKIAQKTMVGEWCPSLEQLWRDVPIYAYTLLNNVIVKYGYCRTEGDLWFVSYPGNTFIVDEVCAKPELINYIGTDTRKWTSICWCYLTHEVNWDDLKTGMDSKQLGSYILENTPSAEKIELYLSEMKKVR